MKFIRIDLLTLLISLFILNSCKNQDNIGLGINSANQLNGNLMDTSTIVINTQLDDSVVTSGQPKTPLSYWKDPEVGTTEANLAIDLNLPFSGAYTKPTGTITIDSAVLVLRYADGFAGDSLTSRYNAIVQQLSERIFAGSYYYNTKKWKHGDDILGTKSFFSRTHDNTVKILSPVVGLPDTLVKIHPQLRVRINPAFIRSILFDAPDDQLESNLVFKNRVKGLYITLDKGQTGPGGTFMFALDSTSVDVYYKAVNGSTIDTAVVQLPSTLHAAEVKHDYSTQVKTELANQASSRNTFYIKGLSGLRAKIAFPNLKSIFKTIGSDVILNRAELVVSPVAGSIIPFAPLPRLSLYKYDLAHQRSLVEDSDPNDPKSFASSGGFGGYYVSSQKQYQFLVTSYIQNLMRGKTVDYGTYIGNSDGDIFSLEIASSAQSDGRTFAVGSDKNSPYRLKLNLFYTKLSK
jgi:hypothetical protein